MKALALDKPGKPDTLHLADLPKPQPGLGEVRVRVEAVSLNPVDYKLARSGHPAWTYPFILGLDVAGVVDAVGDGVENWQPGDQVFYHGNLSKPGGFAEYAIAAAHVLARIAPGVSFEAAAAIPCAGLTAYQALYRKLHLQAGQTVLVQGGAGGVGGFGVQLATNTGATVITTASARNFQYVKNLGATYVIDYNTEDVKERVFEITHGRGLEAVLDTVNSKNATLGTELLAFGGSIACIAGMPDFSIVSFDKPISVHAVMLGGAYFSGDRLAEEDLGHMADEMMALLAEQKIDAMVSEVIMLEQIPTKLNELAARHVSGKIVAKLN
ncbi:MAG: zinc-binding dehydrogenase [Anaerolineae bacterium]|nr:zinc-binding dehydrogenase [Anaerolineae bacterium]